MKAGVAVLRDLFGLIVLEPIREGRLRPADWPLGLRPIVVGAGLLYAAISLVVMFAGPLRSTDVLLVTSSGATVPDLGVSVILSGTLVALAMMQTAALHVSWPFRLVGLMVTGALVLQFSLLHSAEPLALVPAVLGYLGVVGLALGRWRASFAWWEFPAVATALGVAIFAPGVVNPTVQQFGLDARALQAQGTLITLQLLAFPALMVAGAALAQIAVTASFAAVAAGMRELSRPMLAGAGLLVLVWAGADLVLGFRTPDEVTHGWAASAIALAFTGLLTAGVIALAGRLPAWDDLAEDPTTLNYLIALGCTVHAILSLPISILREVARLAGLDAVFAFSDAYVLAMRSDWINPAVRVLVGLVGIVVAARIAQRRTGHAAFLVAYFAMAALDLLRLTEIGPWVHETVPQMSRLLIMVVLALGGWFLITRTLTLRRLSALASALMLCLLYPHRSILDDPISAALGFSGLAALLFGLIWRVLTEGDITRTGSRGFPVTTRVLGFAANGLLAVCFTAYAALTRTSGGPTDPTAFGEVGDAMLGVPLFLAAAISCLAIAVAPAGVGDQPR